MSQTWMHTLGTIFQKSFWHLQPKRLSGSEFSAEKLIMWRCDESRVSRDAVCLCVCVLKEYKHDFSASSSLSPFTFFPLSMPLPRLIIDFHRPRLWADRNKSVAWFGVRWRLRLPNGWLRWDSVGYKYDQGVKKYICWLVVRCWVVMILLLESTQLYNLALNWTVNNHESLHRQRLVNALLQLLFKTKYWYRVMSVIEESCNNSCFCDFIMRSNLLF